MQLVIDLDENLYTRLFDNGGTDVADMHEACTAIRKGEKLSKNSTNSILDKIKTEIEEIYAGCYVCEYDENYDWEENDISEYYPVGNINDILDIIDEHRTKGED